MEYDEPTQKQQFSSILESVLPEPHMSITAHSLLAVSKGQDLFTQATVLWKRLLVHLLHYVTNQHLRRGQDITD